MANITIRNLGDDVNTRLRLRAPQKPRPANQIYASYSTMVAGEYFPVNGFDTPDLVVC